MTDNAFLITGANAGIGKDVARQLALHEDVDTIYLACRNETKAHAARDDLHRITGRSIFEILTLDTTDLDSVRAAAAAIPTPLRAVLLNAGGSGGSAPLTRTADGCEHDLRRQRPRSRGPAGGSPQRGAGDRHGHAHR